MQVRYSHDEYLDKSANTSNFTKDKSVIMDRLMKINERTYDKLFNIKFSPFVEQIIDAVDESGFNILGYDAIAMDCMGYSICPSHTILVIYLPLPPPEDKMNRVNKIRKIIANLNLPEELFYGFNYEVYYVKEGEKI